MALYNIEPSNELDFILGPGCAQYPPGEVMPTQEEIDGLALADFSVPDNVRKLARIIATKNSMEQAALLTGELSYAYQHGNYDVASMAENLRDMASKDDYDEVIQALDDIGKPGYSSPLIYHLMEAVKAARDFTP